MQRIDWVETRLLNWARWKVGSGGGVLGFSAVEMGQTNGGRNGYASAAIPIFDAEAAETDEAVQRIEPFGCRMAVKEHYTGQGTTTDKCARLCCSRAAMAERVSTAHQVLAAHFLAKQAKARAERKRVEGLILQKRVLHRSQNR